MIQRIQTVYLLLGVVAMVTLFFFNEVWQEAAAIYAWVSLVILVLTGLAGLTGLVAIFLYANRSLQRTIVVGAQVLTLLLAVALYGGLYFGGKLSVMTPAGTVDGSQVLVLLIPIGAYVMYYLARRSIDSDIELIKSMDRLR